MLYKTEYFDLGELVPEYLYKEFLEKRILYKLWSLFDPKLLITADFLRERYGKATCNDWLWGGNFNYRGFRPFNTEIGAKWSQHKFGRALDLVFENATSEEVRKDILDNKDSGRFVLINAIEMNVSWLHFDIRNTNRILKIYKR